MSAGGHNGTHATPLNTEGARSIFTVHLLEILMPWSIVQRVMVEFLQPFLERIHQKSTCFRVDQD